MQIISINRKSESRLFLVLIAVLILNILLQLIELGDSTVDIHIHDTYLVVDRWWILTVFVTSSLTLYFISLGIYCFAQLGRWQRAVSTGILLLYLLLLIAAGACIYHYIEVFVLTKNYPELRAVNLANQQVKRELIRNLPFNASVVFVFLFIPIIRIIQLVRLFRRK